MAGPEKLHNPSLELPIGGRISHAQIESEPYSPELKRELKALMTPKEILEQTEFAYPKVIHPNKYPTFEDLLQARDEIRNLRLLPAKSDEQYAWYHSFTKEQLTDLVTKTIGSDLLVFAPNQFPYYVPQDTEQNIVWVGNSEVTDDALVEFMAKVLQGRNKTADEVILFERPLKTDSKLVRGTIPAYRHVHLWLKSDVAHPFERATS